jgi:hypothetical protein
MTNGADMTTQTSPVRTRPAVGVKEILKAELKRRGLTYADLVARLAEQGVSETEANLRNKISRGSFTATFFMQCLVAMGCEQVPVPAPARPRVDQEPPR